MAFVVLAVATVLPGADDPAARSSAPYRAYLSYVATEGLASPVAPDWGSGELPALPGSWPATLELGAASSPGSADRDRAAGLGFRYQYLAGGVNTGRGWSTWAPSGAFVSRYIQESVRAGIIPVFSYYQVRQSAPGAGLPDPEAVMLNLSDEAMVVSYLAELELFFRQAGAEAPATIVLDFEPDLWGFVQQRARLDDATSVPVAVVGDAAALARAVIALRDRFAPNVLVAYHHSTWGTGEDPVYTNPSASQLNRLADRAVAFYRSLDADFDLVFAEFSDRDAGFRQHVYGDGGASWWDAGDFARNLAMLRRLTTGTGLRIVLWQIPQGNTRMRAANNTWNHFQDNKVEWLLGEPTLTHLREYLDAGVIALLFGRGADGATCACDAAGDGTTNPPPINGNERPSLGPEDDGGYFAERTEAYVVGAPLALPPGN